MTLQSALLVLVAPLVAKIIGLYDYDPARLRKSTLDEFPVLAQFAALMAFLALISSPVIFSGILGPREAMALFVVVLASLTAGRVFVRRIGGRLVSPERCLFIGSADEAMRFGEKLAHDHATNARLVAQIELDNASPWASPSIDRAVAHARRLVRQLEIQRVIIAPHTSGSADTLDLMRTFGATEARVSVIPAILQVVGSAVEFDDVHGVAVLGVRSFSLPRSSQIVKRMFDMLSASLGLAVTAPLIATTAVLVKLSSRGPVFFRQERVGRGGRPFELLKFRSMCVDAEERKRELAGDNEAAEGFFKIADDPRITPLGRAVAIDYLYVANWSLWTDLKLLLRTVPHVLSARGL